MLFLFLMLLLLFPASSHAALWTGIIDPTRAVDWTSAGVVGGIPIRTTICSTLTSTATTTTINAAIAACPSGQVVFLSAGTYNLSTGITFTGVSNVTLRGAGPDQTKLVFTGGDSCNGLAADICVTGSSTVYNGSVPAGNIHNWTAGFSQGATVITLDSVSGLAVNMVLILDQLNDSSPGTSLFVTDAAPYSFPGNDIGRAGRSQRQLVKITAINGLDVTISPGLYMPNWSAGKTPQAWFLGTVAQTAVLDGVENLSLDHTSSTALSGIELVNGYNNWVKNVRSLQANRNHVWALMGAHYQVQDSYFYGTQQANTTSYGIESSNSSDGLFVNNIFQHITAPLMNGTTTGDVLAYNYMIDMYQTISPTFMYAAFWPVHAAGASMNLFEGNDGDGANLDIAHGTSNLITVYRNVLYGTEAGKTLTGGSTNAIINTSYQRYSHFIGNVLGTSTYHVNYEDSDAASGTKGDPVHSIYLLGYTGANETYQPGLPFDATTISSMMRWGNYDTVNAAVRWVNAEVPSGITNFPNAVPADHILPASFFYASQPSWWNSQFNTVPPTVITAKGVVAATSRPAASSKASSSVAATARPATVRVEVTPGTGPGPVTWPPIGPDVTGGDITGVGGFAYKIPARLCYENTPADGANPYKAFNANNCY